MEIQAISAMQPCQPIKPVNFAKKHAPIKQKEAVAEDSFESTQPVMAQKYDLACRIAAFYKQQYENLVKQGTCEA